MNRRKEKSLSAITCHWWSLIIPIGSHRQHICSSFASRMWWAEAAYPLITLISALFIHLLPDPSYAQKFFVPENVRGKCFFFSFYTKSSVFTKLSRATTSHLVCCCIKLWHQPLSNCFQTRQGLSFRFIFHFLAQVSVAQHPAKADNEKRCMMSCRWSTRGAKILWPTFQEVITFLCHFLCCLSPCSVFFLPSSQWENPSFPSDNIQVPHVWKHTW